MFHSYKFYGSDMSGILFFTFASCEPLSCFTSDCFLENCRLPIGSVFSVIDNTLLKSRDYITAVQIRKNLGLQYTRWLPCGVHISPFIRSSPVMRYYSSFILERNGTREFFRCREHYLHTNLCYHK